MTSYIAYLRKNESSGYRIEFPDLPECVSTARSLEEAGVMASEDLLRHLTALVSFGFTVPPATPLAQLAGDPRRGGSELVVVDLDLELVANSNLLTYHNP